MKASFLVNSADDNFKKTEGICILLPVLNEIKNIQELISRIHQILKDHHYMICFVDDGSRDGTVEFIQEQMKQADCQYHLIQRTKTGYGSQRGSALYVALLWVLRETNCQTLIEMDGDLSHRPEEIPIGLKILQSGGVDIVIASKYLPSARVTNRPLGRRSLSAFCNLMVRCLLSPHVSDYSNGYRFYTRRAALQIAESTITYTSPIYLSEVMAIWLKNKLHIQEYPSHYVGRNEGLSKLRLIDIIKAGLAIFEIAIRLRIPGFDLKRYWHVVTDFKKKQLIR